YLTSDSKIDVECRDAQGRDQAEFRGIGRMVVGSKKFKREAESRADRIRPGYR
ncbi:MAG: hypothetical protein QG657_4517, partial [Acidobacteriota bacterium]|nr:hypothetical protein [Acidobacteriota bacterium]